MLLVNHKNALSLFFSLRKFILYQELYFGRRAKKLTPQLHPTS